MSGERKEGGDTEPYEGDDAPDRQDTHRTVEFALAVYAAAVAYGLDDDRARNVAHRAVNRALDQRDEQQRWERIRAAEDPGPWEEPGRSAADTTLHFGK